MRTSARTAMSGDARYCVSTVIVTVLVLTGSLHAQRQMERLSRGLIAVNQGAGEVYVGWRLLGTDPDDIAFNVYRGDTKVNEAPIADSTNFIDEEGDPNATYAVRPVVDAVETQYLASQPVSASVWPQNYLSIPLQTPAGGTTRDGVRYTYTAHDCSVGDLDGDSEYEIVLKWIPANHGSSRYKGPSLFDAYELDGSWLWRIDLGTNVSLDNFIVYDLDGDGKAELACMTADGTVSGTGHVIGDPNADWVSTSGGSIGRVVSGPEYLTIFNGPTGAALATTRYVPTRDPLDGWGGIGGNGNNDSIGNRANKFLACAAYLDGHRPSLVTCRGYFGRSVLVAWDWREGRLAPRWIFDSGISYPPYSDASPYSGMGNHNISVADVDGDGKDEIVYGAMVVDDNGQGLCTSGLRHGDALHVGDLDPSRPGLEVFGPHENEGRTASFGTPGAAMYDARTGQLLFGAGPGVDVGRGVAEDIDPRYPGCENWGGPGGLRDCRGQTISQTPPSSTNFVIWWDADLTRELLDHNHIDKWNWAESTTDRLLTASECASNNGTKAVPCLSADLFGDWREEVIWRTTDSTALHIYTTTIPAVIRTYTLMHDPQYRLSIAWQNVGYNQPPHPGFYFGVGMSLPPRPDLVWAGNED